MVAKRAPARPALPDPAALDYAIRLIHQVCCFAGSFDLVDEFSDKTLVTAVAQHDTAALFDRLMHDFSFQGISDQIAANYMARHGQATWRSVRRNLAKRPSCPKLQTYWAFHDWWRQAGQIGMFVCSILVAFILLYGVENYWLGWLPS